MLYCAWQNFGEGRENESSDFYSADFARIWSDSSIKSKIRTNQCCFVGGCIFAGGVLKEYLYYHMGPKLIEKGIWTAHFSELLYGALSTLLYYFALPTVMVFCYYFCGLDQKMIPIFFRSVCLLSYLPAVIMCIFIQWQNIIIYQKDRVFCLSVGFYNVGYAALATDFLWRICGRTARRGNFIRGSGRRCASLQCWCSGY